MERYCTDQTDVFRTCMEESPCDREALKNAIGCTPFFRPDAGLVNNTECISYLLVVKQFSSSFLPPDPQFQRKIDFSATSPSIDREKPKDNSLVSWRSYPAVPRCITP